MTYFTRRHDDILIELNKAVKSGNGGNPNHDPKNGEFTSGTGASSILEGKLGTGTPTKNSSTNYPETVYSKRFSKSEGPKVGTAIEKALSAKGFTRVEHTSSKFDSRSTYVHQTKGGTVYIDMGHTKSEYSIMATYSKNVGKVVVIHGVSRFRGAV